VFTAKAGETQPRLPGGEMLPDPPADKDKLYKVEPGPKTRGVPSYSRRLLLAERLPRAETPGFARNIANRLWAIMLGRGLIHPLDLTHAGNRPSHPELLGELEQFLVAQAFDMRALLREIALSQTYQRASELPESTATAPDAFAVAALRGLSPEQFAWSLLRAAGRYDADRSGTSRSDKDRSDKDRSDKDRSDKDRSDVAASSAQPELPPWRQRQKQLEPLERQAKAIASVFAPLPGQPDGEFQPAVDHALFLLNNPAVAGLAQSAPTSLAGRLEKIDATPDLADELYLSVLGRRATTEERALVDETLANATSTSTASTGTSPTNAPPTGTRTTAGNGTAHAAARRDALQGLVWGLMLSAEFRLNH